MSQTIDTPAETLSKTQALLGVMRSLIAQGSTLTTTKNVGTQRCAIPLIITLTTNRHKQEDLANTLATLDQLDYQQIPIDQEAIDAIADISRTDPNCDISRLLVQAPFEACVRFQRKQFADGTIQVILHISLPPIDPINQISPVRICRSPQEKQLLKSNLPTDETVTKAPAQVTAIQSGTGGTPRDFIKVFEARCAAEDTQNLAARAAETAVLDEKRKILSSLSPTEKALLDTIEAIIGSIDHLKIASPHGHINNWKTTYVIQPPDRFGSLDQWTDYLLQTIKIPQSPLGNYLRNWKKTTQRLTDYFVKPEAALLLLKTLGANPNKDQLKKLSSIHLSVGFGSTGAAPDSLRGLWVVFPDLNPAP